MAYVWTQAKPVNRASSERWYGNLWGTLREGRHSVRPTSQKWLYFDNFLTRINVDLVVGVSCRKEIPPIILLSTTQIPRFSPCRIYDPSTRSLLTCQMWGVGTPSPSGTFVTRDSKYRWTTTFYGGQQKFRVNFISPIITRSGHRPLRTGPDPWDRSGSLSVSFSSKTSPQQPYRFSR